MLHGTAVSAGFVVSKLLAGNGTIAAFFNCEIYRVILIASIIAEYIYILFLKIKMKKHADKTEENTSSKADLFPERKDDLQRLNEYINKFDTIGILGDWGSGKTYLVNEFINRNQDSYEVIKVEALTCNLDSIDSYIFKQLENVLWRNRIYPRYSRQIQNLMEENSIIKQLRSIFIKGSHDKTTAFNGFCNDIKKLKKTILLVCEDIDRISENYVDQIAKIMDISAKLAGNNVKVIYEYDQKRMADLGFRQDYMEKYIPYMINLTDIPFMRLLDKELEEEKQLNGELSREDFRFLTMPIYDGSFLQKAFGVDFSFTIQLIRLSPRKMKEFVGEVNLAMKNVEFAKKENRETTIVFYYLKIFMWQLYEELPFCDDLEKEVKFERRVVVDGIVHSYYYSTMDLVNLLKHGEIDSGQVRKMFTSNYYEIEEEYVVWNRNKLALLIMLGFNFEELQNAYDSERAEQKPYERNPILDEEIFRVNRMEHNLKINRLIKNLYMNGKSEYTNSEANAIVFIDEVLFAKDEEQEQRWKEYNNRCCNTEIYKDNTTIFTWGGDEWLSLAKAIRTVVGIPKYTKKRRLIKGRFLDFWIEHNTDKIIMLEKVATLRLIEPDDKENFIKAITYFNSLEVAGNMNAEKTYIEFLDTYVSIAYRLGYIYGGYCYHSIKDIGRIKDQNGELLKEILEDIIRDFYREMEKKNYPESAQGEFELVKEFLEKNIELIGAQNKDTWKKMKFKTSMTERRNYQNEEVFMKLKAMLDNENEEERPSKQEFRKYLDEEYEKGNISLREYRELIRYQC